jgi:CHAT domain-containing protein
VEPLAPHLEGVKSLVLVPNGPLHQLPFASLPWRGGYLIQAFDLRHLSSASLLAAVLDRPVEPNGMLVVGNPTPPDPRWRPLPSAEIEAGEVAAMFPGTRAIVGAAARRDTLIGQDLSRRIVHLALHGQAGEIKNTRLVLSDGYLTVEDVWGLSLEGAPLVVLSACETALGVNLSGDEVVSLANGFLFAGSRAVVSSLWKVDDDSTRDLMTTFYRLRADGTATALAEAQRALIAKGYGPYHWAAFTLTGW